MSFLDCSDEVVEALYKIVSAAQTAVSNSELNNQESPRRSVESIDLQDIDCLIDALHVLRPNLIEISTFDAWMQIIRGQWKDAIQTMTHVVECREEFTYGKAMLAYCLYMDNQPGWRTLAEEVMARGQPEVAVHLIRMLEQYAEVREGKISSDMLVEICQQRERGQSDDDGDAVPAITADVDYTNPVLKA